MESHAKQHGDRQQILRYQRSHRKLEGGNMKTTMETQSILAGHIVVSFKVLRCGSGKFGLTNKDQCDVTVMQNQAT